MGEWERKTDCFATVIIKKRVKVRRGSCGEIPLIQGKRMISVRFQGKPFNITVIQVYAPTSNAEEAEIELFYNIYKTF